MQDLTIGPLTRHLLKSTSFMLVTMVFQTLYFLIERLTWDPASAQYGAWSQ